MENPHGLQWISTKENYHTDIFWQCINCGSKEQSYNIFINYQSICFCNKPWYCYLSYLSKIWETINIKLVEYKKFISPLPLLSTPPILTAKTHYSIYISDVILYLMGLPPLPQQLILLTLLSKKTVWIFNKYVVNHTHVFAAKNTLDRGGGLGGLSLLLLPVTHL